jgi:hypothetical protein
MNVGSDDHEITFAMDKSFVQPDNSSVVAGEENRCR